MMDAIEVNQRRGRGPNRVGKYEVRDSNGLITKFVNYAAVGAFVGVERTTVWRSITAAKRHNDRCFVNDYEILTPVVPHAH